MPEENTTKETDTVSKSGLSDLLIVSLCLDKYKVVQNQDGTVSALKHGEPWRNCTGDELVLALARALARMKELVELARDTYIEENSDGETDCVTPYDIYS